MTAIPNFVSEMLGCKFHKWTVISYVGRTASDNHRVAVRCDCGNERTTMAAHVKYGKSKDCGCGRKKSVGALFTKHGFLSNYGQHKPSEYAIWSSMLARCYNPKNQNYPWYGGSGITVCDRWRHGENGETGFACFYKDMGPRPTQKHTLDRRNAGDYEPSNCQWLTMKEQCAPGKRRKYGTALLK